MSLRIVAIVLAAMLALLILAGFQSEPKSSTTYNGFDLVDKAGNIRKPSDFRDRYQVLGSYLVQTGAGDQMHVTYASPGAAAYHRSHGSFPDGTVLVKEVLASDHAQMTTGDAHWATKPIQWFVLIKDAKGRYASNPLWGDGWGWALFKADAPDKQVATDHKVDCLGCHIPAKQTDWIYTTGYPVLAAK